MKWKYTAILASMLMVSMSFAVLASADTSVDAPAVPGAYENWENFNRDMNLEQPAVSNALGIAFVPEDGPYPQLQPDGRPEGTEPMGAIQPDSSWTPFGNYASDIFYDVPYGPGGGWALEATGGTGNYGTGSTHESWIGDQNGNGVQEWISYYSYAPWFTDGIDNDGDGCVDEKSYGDYLSKTCGNVIPDGFVYFETGVKPDAGGEKGDLLVVADWFASVESIKIFRAGVSPPWGAFVIRGDSYYPQIAGEHINFRSYERYYGVNVNAAAGDTDMFDSFVGNIDARLFPLNPPTLHFCMAGYQQAMGAITQLEDGTVVGAVYSSESADGYSDWNKDGDTWDAVFNYYVVDKVTGECNKGVNTQVYGTYPRISGSIMMGSYMYEGSDRRDWNGNGNTFQSLQLYHDIDSTIGMAGPMYTSSTWTAPRQPFGNGFTGAALGFTGNPFPLNFGGASSRYQFPQRYQTYYFHVADEDGIPNTLLPQYLVGYGQPADTPGGACIATYMREWYLNDAGVDLIGTTSDGNGDGDYLYGAPYGADTLNALYCPDEAVGGTGQWIIEPTSKYANGFYTDDVPVTRTGYAYFASSGKDASGWTIMPIFWVEGESAFYYGSQMDDANGDLLVNGQYGLDEWYVTYDWIMLGKADFEILELEVLGETQPGGTVVARLKLQNTGGVDFALPEDEGIENDRGYKLQGLAGRDVIGPDGIVQPQETATVYITLTVSAGEDLGLIPVKIFVTIYGTTKEATVDIPVILKMFGDDLSCYRHRQNALRTLRAFDMDDDEGMLHNLEIDDEVIVGDQNMLPEDAILLLLSWFEVGCKVGHENVERAHSASASLTGHYGMGMQYWGFAPGQEEGNEGNGNGGLTGQARKDVYGI